MPDLFVGLNLPLCRASVALPGLAGDAFGEARSDVCFCRGLLFTTHPGDIPGDIGTNTGTDGGLMTFIGLIGSFKPGIVLAAGFSQS